VYVITYNIKILKIILFISFSNT